MESSGVNWCMACWMIPFKNWPVVIRILPRLLVKPGDPPCGRCVPIPRLLAIISAIWDQGGTNRVFPPQGLVVVVYVVFQGQGQFPFLEQVLADARMVPSQDIFFRFQNGSVLVKNLTEDCPGLVREILVNDQPADIMQQPGDKQLLGLLYFLVGRHDPGQNPAARLCLITRSY